MVQILLLRWPDDALICNL